MKIQMVDLFGQYSKIRQEIDAEIQKILNDTTFINGPKVYEFAGHLADFLHVKHIIPCANGTDALQIALMALELKPDDEVIVPNFTYVASAEVIGLLKLKPVIVDVDYESFNVTIKNIRKALTSKTKAIIPVHLFGQSCDMEPILEFANEKGVYVIEDNAQALGAIYKFSNGSSKYTGTMGNIGCTSFFPSKNLGCFGDGGAISTNDDQLAERIRMIANHGQRKKYYHQLIGCNSRLDTIQAAVLDVKLKYLTKYGEVRYEAAQYYTEKLSGIKEIIIPKEIENSTHVFHQYTLKILNGRRDELKQFLFENHIPTMIYYPLPLHQQQAFLNISTATSPLDISELLSNSVLSLPIHTEMTRDEQDFIVNKIKDFFQ